MSQKIRLNATEDVKEFVQAASKCDFDVDISYNRVIIDAKIHSWNSQHGSDQGPYCNLSWGRSRVQPFPSEVCGSVTGGKHRGR